MFLKLTHMLRSSLESLVKEIASAIAHPSEWWGSFSSVSCTQSVPLQYPALCEVTARCLSQRTTFILGAFLEFLPFSSEASEGKFCELYFWLVMNVQPVILWNCASKH